MPRKSSDSLMLHVSEENKLEVRKIHSTYYQIQCQLALLVFRLVVKMCLKEFNCC